MPTNTLQLPASADQVARKIYLVRGQRVMLDAELAELYQVSTKALNQAVKRNAGRFPADFMFQLTAEEVENLKSQIVTSSWGGRRTLPYAFTEHGVAMLSAVLRSERAVQMSLLIIRAFIRMRQVLASHRELARQIERLEITQKDHAALLSVVVSDIENLEKDVTNKFKRLQRPAKRKSRIGFMPV